VATTGRFEVTSSTMPPLPMNDESRRTFDGSPAQRHQPVCGLDCKTVVLAPVLTVTIQPCHVAPLPGCEKLTTCRAFPVTTKRAASADAARSTRGHTHTTAHIRLRTSLLSEVLHNGIKKPGKMGWVPLFHVLD
jgi:hypothetical protein